MDQPRTGFTLFHLVTAVGVSAILVGLLMPAMHRIHEIANRPESTTAAQAGPAQPATRPMKQRQTVAARPPAATWPISLSMRETQRPFGFQPD